MSVRDQREGTGLSDRVKEDVSQEYFTLSKQTYTPDRGLVRGLVKGLVRGLVKTRRDRRCKEGRQTNCQNISGVEGAFG